MKLVLDTCVGEDNKTSANQMQEVKLGPRIYASKCGWQQVYAGRCSLS